MSARGGRDRIAAALAAARRDGRPALAAYLTAGFPSATAFADLLPRIAAAADLVEVGVPFSDPMADGPVIQRASRIALASGATLRSILDTLRRVPSGRGAPALLMSYLNPLLSFGLADVAREAARAGACGLIVPDLPLEESDELAGALDREGLALVQLVSPATSPSRLARLCRASAGFVYAVTVTGVTGGRTGASDDLRDYLDRVRAVSPLPVLAGFGVRERSQVEALAAHADGVVVGSALIERIERGEDPVAFLRQLGGATAARQERP
jgi:tryptophan synthase alpha chain